MQLEKITDEFYQLTDVFDISLLKKLITPFNQSSTWEKLTATDKNGTVRYQRGLMLDDPLSREICQGLSEAIGFMEKQLGAKLYQNSPQLWEDAPGYINEIHRDVSPNLKVNIQVYLSNSASTDVGTHIFKDNQWFSVPYKLNCGYIMLDPTKILHGTRYPVVDFRRSLYQSFRDTQQAVDIW